MAKTKQEVIVAAYGEYWDLFDEEDKKSILNNDGWHYKWNHPLRWEMAKTGVEIITSAYVVGTSWKPKSLAGIENNNGWTKIDSEADLKLKDGGYWGVMPYDYGHDNRIEAFYVKDGIHKINGLHTCYEITHYQAIQKPSPPIY
jgi:hypothetical protein